MYMCMVGVTVGMGGWMGKGKIFCKMKVIELYPYFNLMEDSGLLVRWCK